MITTLAVAGYRSLRDLVVGLGSLNVVTGANGTGKSTLYRALRLLGEVAHGGLIVALAREGGLPSALWAGERGGGPAARKEPVALQLGFAGDEMSYSLELGLPSAGGQTMFQLDPAIKRECIWTGPVFRPSAVMVDRTNALAKARGDGKDWHVLTTHLPSFDSMLARSADPVRAPEMVNLREEIRGWRFYDHFRTDAGAPARAPQIGTHTPVLAHDGSDVAAALRTIIEIGDSEALAQAVDDAFPGCTLGIVNNDGRFEVEMKQPGLLRPLRSGELSDGTLRYVLWIAALLTPRPPSLMVLNEPESSLHPDLLPALGRLIAQAAQRSQIVVVTHATRLVAALESEPDCNAVHLDKQSGQTVVTSATLETPRWSWPPR